MAYRCSEYFLQLAAQDATYDVEAYLDDVRDLTVVFDTLNEKSTERKLNSCENYILAHVYEERGDIEKAKYYYKLSVNHGNYLAMMGLGNVYRTYGYVTEKDIDKSIHYYAMALDHTGQALEALNELCNGAALARILNEWKALKKEKCAKEKTM